MTDQTLIRVQENLNVSKNVYYVYSDKTEGFNFGYLLFIPGDVENQSRLIVEVDTIEASSYGVTIKSALDTMDRINKTIKKTKYAIIIPIIPCKSDQEKPYQQLSKECFSKETGHKYYRVDIQLIKMIADAKKRINQLTGKELQKKIFLKGYSTSGVFAQRFALLHPELIDSLCVGGAINFTPIPLSEINDQQLCYPVGVSDIEAISGIKFNEEKYKEIKFFSYILANDPIANNLTPREPHPSISQHGSPIDRISKIYLGLGYKFHKKVIEGKYRYRPNDLYGLSDFANADINEFFINGTTELGSSIQMNM